jgi:hypothetical protein
MSEWPVSRFIHFTHSDEGWLDPQTNVTVMKKILNIPVQPIKHVLLHTTNNKIHQNYTITNFLTSHSQHLLEVFLGLVIPECQAIPTAAKQLMHDESFDEPLLSGSGRDYELAEVAVYLYKTKWTCYYNNTTYEITDERN